MRPTAHIFSMKQSLVVPYINPANHAPGVQTGYIPGGHLHPQTYNGKNLKDLLLWNQQAHSLYI